MVYTVEYYLKLIEMKIKLATLEYKEDQWNFAK